MDYVTQDEEKTLRSLMIRSIHHPELFFMQMAYANAKELWTYMSEHKERRTPIFRFVITKWISVFGEEGNYSSLAEAKEMQPGDFYELARSYASQIFPKIRELRDGVADARGQTHKTFYTEQEMSEKLVAILDETEEKTAIFSIMMLLYNFSLDPFNIFGAEPYIIPYVSTTERPQIDIFDDAAVQMVKEDPAMQDALATMRGCFHSIFQDYSNMGYAMEAMDSYLKTRAPIDTEEIVNKKRKFLHYYFLYFFQEQTKVGYKSLMDIVNHLAENLSTTIMAVAQEKVPAAITEIMQGQKDILTQLASLDEEAIKKLAENENFAQLVFRANYYLQKSVLADSAKMGDKNAKRQIELIEKIEQKRMKGESLEPEEKKKIQGVL